MRLRAGTVFSGPVQGFLFQTGARMSFSIVHELQGLDGAAGRMPCPRFRPPTWPGTWKNCPASVGCTSPPAWAACFFSTLARKAACLPCACWPPMMPWTPWATRAARISRPPRRSFCLKSRLRAACCRWYAFLSSVPFCPRSGAWSPASPRPCLFCSRVSAPCCAAGSAWRCWMRRPSPFRCLCATSARSAC